MNEYTIKHKDPEDCVFLILAQDDTPLAVADDVEGCIASLKEQGFDVVIHDDFLATVTYKSKDGGQAVVKGAVAVMKIKHLVAAFEEINNNKGE